MTTEKIEDRKIEKLRKFFLYFGILFFVLVPFQFLTVRPQELTSVIWWIGIVVQIGFVTCLLIKVRKDLSSRAGQFIEWTPESINFKLRGDASPKTIGRDKIQNIDIHIDTITITDLNGQKFLLDISDFEDYEERKRIKENFAGKKSS